MTDNPEALLQEAIAGYTHDPLGFAKFIYPWGEAGDLESHPGPRVWQARQLDKLGKQLRNKATRWEPIMLAIASGHGIGKSALIGQIIHWAMSTCEDCKVVVTSNTDTQLRTKTWPEVCKWFKLALNHHWFKLEATSIFALAKGHEDSWKVNAIPWSEHNSEAFAGLHNVKKRIVVVMDEASAISDKIWEVVEGALTDEETEIIWVVFGNPTRATGRFRECFRRFKHRWIGEQIDSREVEGTNKAQIQKWIDDCGEDSDFVKVRVWGMFPNMSAKQFISSADVDPAFGRHLKITQYGWAPKIISCDPAWGGDDELVIAQRQGLMFKILEVMPKNDNDILVANKLARWEDDEHADAVFVDGGYGTGIVSAGRTLNRNWQIVWFSGESADPGCLNKRSEMWNSTKKWLKEGGALPEDQVLRDDLLGPETVPRLDGKIQLEPKDAMKSRGLPSPNRGDSLALTFAFPVAARMTEQELISGRKPQMCIVATDPMEGW